MTTIAYFNRLLLNKIILDDFKSPSGKVLSGSLRKFAIKNRNTQESQLEFCFYCLKISMGFLNTMKFLFNS